MTCVAAVGEGQVVLARLGCSGVAVTGGRETAVGCTM